jgi:chromate reductase, NAD(P)H dehydrogenase (quinone)
MKVVGLSGSLRETSSNTALLRALPRLSPDIELLRFDIDRLPHFSPDRDVDPLPAAVQELRAAIEGCDALAISSPEYAHGVPGSLKNALDWLVSATEVLDKRVLLICAAPGAAPFAHAALLEVLKTMSLPVVDAGAHRFSSAQLDAAGEVMPGPVLDALAVALGQLRS